MNNPRVRKQVLSDDLRVIASLLRPGRYTAAKPSRLILKRDIETNNVKCEP